jgi:hypothetical protein
MLTEIISAVLGATAAALVTWLLTRAVPSGERTRLQGKPLASLPDYPIKVGEDGLLHIDLALMERATKEVLRTYNPRAAVDLLYLVEHNRSFVNQSTLLPEQLERVRRKYRRRLGDLAEPQSLLDQREHLLKQFYNITDGLGETFAGTPIEFVLHDTRDPLHSICVIKNSITGRRVGEQVSTWGEDVVLAYEQMRWTGTKHSYRLRHPRDGRELKATTIPLEDKTLGLIAFLCINIDIERLSPGSPELAKFAERLVATPGGWGAQVFNVESPSLT